MEQHNSDRDIKLLFERNVPSVDTDEVWRSLRQEIGLRQRGSRPRRAWLRPMLAATVAMVLLAAAVGVLEVVTHLGGGESVIVLRSDDTPQTTAAAATTTTAAGSATFFEPTIELAPLVEALREAEIVPLSVEPDPSEPNGIIVRVPADKTAPPDGIFFRHRLMRELPLAIHRLGLPFTSCRVSSLDAQGKETSVFGMNPQGILVYAKEWSSGELVDESRALILATKALYAVAERAGVQAGDNLELGSRSGSRTLKWTVTLPLEREKEVYLAFLGEVFSAVVQLNHEGCQLAVFELSVNDAEGGPILRDVIDYELQSGGVWYSSDDFMPPGMSGGGPTPSATSVPIPSQEERLETVP